MKVEGYRWNLNPRGISKAVIVSDKWNPKMPEEE